MKAVIGGPYFGEEFEGGVHLALASANGMRTLVPRECLGARSEGIASRSAKGVPVGDRESE